MKITSRVGFVLFFLFLRAHAETAPPAAVASPALYNRKQLAALKSRTVVPELKHDTNLNGRLDPGEVAAMTVQINKAAAEQMSRQEVNIARAAPQVGVDLNQSHTLEDWRELGDVLEKPDKPSQPEHFRMRSTVADFAKESKDVRKLNPAVFSYSRDFLNHSNSWAAKGAAGGFWRENWANISAGFEFERLNTDAPEKKDVDSLTFRSLIHHEKFLGNKVLDTIAWNFGPSYATNFDFKGGLLGGTAELELLWNHNAFTGVWSPPRGGPAVTLRNFIRAEGGATVDDFVDAADADDEYLRAGPQLDAIFWPFGFNENARLRFKAGYGYMVEMAGDGPDFHNFSAGAEYQLDKDGHFVLTLEYNNGRVPLLLTERQALLLSLGVRF